MKEPESIDISDMPDVLKLVEEAIESSGPVILRRGDEVVAEIMPIDRGVGRPIKKRTSEGHAAFLASAGSWKDVDTDAFLADVYESRRLSTKPPVKL